MAAAIFYLISFIFAVSMMVLLPKKSKKINIIVDVMFSYVTVLNVTSLIAFVINAIGVIISPVSMGAIFISIGVILGIVVVGKKKIQFHTLRKVDALSVGILVLAVGVLMLHVFTPYLHENYYNNVDPNNHFLYAMSIVRSGKLTGMFYNALYNGMFLKLFSWAMPQVWIYKAFILSDIYHLILELLFFYATVLLVTGEKKTRKYTALIWSLFYWVTFLVFSFLWGFIYWSMAGMLAQYIFMLLKIRKSEEVNFKIVWGCIGIGLFAVTMCYIQFAPVMVCAVMAAVLYDLYKRGKLKFERRYIKVIFGMVVILSGIALIGYKYVFQDRGVGFLHALQMGEQQNIGLEIMLMNPWIILIILKTLREKRQLTEMQIAYVAGMAVQLLFTVLSICHILSTYYLQKGYLILGFVSIAILVEGWSCLEKKTVQSMCWLYMGLLSFLVISYAGNESKTFSLQQSTLVQNLDILSGYDFSKGELSDNDKIYLMQYAIEEFQDENGTTPLVISGGAARGTGLWLDATYPNATVICMDDYECTAEKLDELLEKCGATHFMVFFDDLLYIYDLHDYFDSFERVYQNDAGFIGKYQ